MAKFFEIPKAFLMSLGLEPLFPKIPRRRYTNAATIINQFEHGGSMRWHTSIGMHIIAKWLQYNRESFVITWDAGTDTFIIVRRSQLLAAIDDLDVASHQNGYFEPTGTRIEVNAAHDKYTAARKKLLHLLGLGAL